MTRNNPAQQPGRFDSQTISQGYPLWAVLDFAFDSAAGFTSEEDFADSLAGGSPGGHFPVIGWEVSPGTAPLPILATVGASPDVVVLENTRDQAVRVAVEHFRSLLRERKSTGASRA